MILAYAAAVCPRGARWVALASGANAWLGAAPVRAENPLEVEVRGEPVMAAPKEPTVASSVIRRERLEAPGVEIADVLRNEPSVSVLATGGHGATSTASLRGAMAAQTPVYLAGVRLNDDVGGTADLGAVPPWFLSRIEIYRGNAPVAGDMLGIGGAIFLEPRRPSGPEASAGVMLGSYGARSLFGVFGAGEGRRGVLVSVRHDAAKNDYDYQNDNGTRFDPDQAHRAVLSNADVSRLDGWAVGAMQLGATGRVDAIFNASEREQGVPSLALFPSLTARARFARRLAAMSARVACGSGCLLTASSALLSSAARYSDPRRELGWGTSELELRGVRVEHGIALERELGDGWSLGPSLRTSVERLLVAAKDRPEVHAERAFARAALQTTWRAQGGVRLRALVSGECHNTSVDRPVPWAAPGDTSHSGERGSCGQLQPAGRAGVTFETGNLVLLLTLGRYARVPTLAEIYGTSGSVRGNTSLTAEHGASLELGARSRTPLSRSLGTLSFDVFGFVREASDLISYQRSSLGYVRPYNVGSARVLGLETLLAYAPAHWLEATLAVTLTEPRDTSPSRPVGNVLPHVARVVAAPRLEFRTQRQAGRINLFKLGACYLYQGGRFVDRANLVSIPAQGSLDVEATLVALDDELATRVRFSNLLDQTHFDLIGYPLPGRAAYVSVELRL